MPIHLGGDPKIHQAIGKAVDLYTRVEAAQADILQSILKVKPAPASVLFYSVRSVRTQCEMIDALLRFAHGDKFKAFWTKCSTFLFKLSLYRNAIVHWHPHIDVYVKTTRMGFTVTGENVLGNPSLGRRGKSLTLDDFPLFYQDCVYIREELIALARDLKKQRRGRPSHQKYRQAIIRPNLADLQPPARAKEPKPPRPPSKPRLSAAQRRSKALKNARAKS